MDESGEGEVRVDALDVMANLEGIIPYYEPIFSADDHVVIGYEVLGRIKINETIRSLGPFFLDESIPEEFRMEVDSVVLEKAIEAFLETDQSCYLFINRNPNLLIYDEDELFLKQLLSYEKQGLNIKQVVLQITEHNYVWDIMSLKHLLTYYRTYGMKLAVDHVGRENSTMRRVGLLAPEIMKVDLETINTENDTLAYQDVLFSLSLLSRQLGAMLLYQGISNFHLLQYAWKNSGRYYQGPYLGKPSLYFVEETILKERLRVEFHAFIVHEKKKLQAIQGYSDQLNQRLNNCMPKIKKLGNYNEILEMLVGEISDISFRMYICDEDGFQLSSNIEKGKGKEWRLYHQYEMKNWSWRPYFLENIVKMRNKKRGRLSDLYTDIASGEVIRTFSYPIEDNRYLFIDISYEYLYENEGLLK